MSETQMEKCCECIIKIYHQYSARVDHFDMLSKSELKKLIEEQMPNYMKKPKNQKEFDCFFADLDKDKSGQISFVEFLAFMGQFLNLVHERMHQKDGQGQGHGHGHGPGHGHNH